MTGADADPIGPAGVPFPGEHEWLELPDPPAADLTIAPDFVDRTLRALAAAPGEDDALALPLFGEPLRRAFAPPPPSPTFVDDTMQALRRDRTQRWRELLSRHIAPEPSPQFVARTLAALAADRQGARLGGGAPGAGRPRLLRWRLALWPLLAAAAVMLASVLLRDDPEVPLELRFARQEPAAFAHAYAATPMAAVLDARDRARDPTALAAGGPDATWLLLEADR